MRKFIASVLLALSLTACGPCIRYGIPTHEAHHIIHPPTTTTTLVHRTPWPPPWLNHPILWGGPHA